MDLKEISKKLKEAKAAVKENKRLSNSSIPEVAEMAQKSLPFWQEKEGILTKKHAKELSKKRIRIIATIP
jgi:hypothetical protein